VLIGCATAGATIHTTLARNGYTPPDPTEDSPTSTSLALEYGYYMVKAKAWKNGLAPSAVATAVYQVGSPAARHLPFNYYPGKSGRSRSSARRIAPRGPGPSRRSHRRAGLFCSSTRRLLGQCTWENPLGRLRHYPTRTLSYQTTAPNGQSGDQFFNGTISTDNVIWKIGGDRRIRWGSIIGRHEPG